MHILILNWRDIKHEWAGGSEVYLFELAKRWVKQGHKVTLFCGQDVHEKLPDEELISGIRVVRRGGRYSLYFWALVNYIKRFRHETDVVIDVQNGIPFFSVLYSFKPKVGIVYHVHNRQFFVELKFPLSLMGYLMEKFVFPIFYKNTQIMAISNTTKNDLSKLGFKRSNIEIVYCGIEGVKSKKNHKKFVHPTILYLGRIKKYKRVDTLVNIMPDVLKRVPNANLLIAGWGTEGSNLMDMSVRSKARKHVKIVGPVSEAEKRELLSKAWVFVNPSIGEGWGISVIESNLHGTPAIAFKVAGLSESIQHGKTGFLVKNEDELIEKLTEVLKDKKLRDSLSRNSKKWAAKFNWDDAANQSLKILEKVSRKSHRN